jgi:hypothetical protein
MLETNQNSPEFVKGMLMGLIIECPLGGNPKDCQLYEHRKRTMDEKIGWVKSLSDEEYQQVYHLHCECLKKKEKKERSLVSN